MKKVLMVIAQFGFQDIEYRDSRAELEKKGIGVTVASVTTKEATGKFGGKIKPDVAIKDARALDFDAILLVGGPGAPALGSVIELFKLLSEFEKQSKIISAICIAPTLLAKAGLLRYKKVTVWNGDGMQSIILEREGAIYLPDAVVVDGRVITGNGPEAAKDFGAAVASALQK